MKAFEGLLEGFYSPLKAYQRAIALIGKNAIPVWDLLNEIGRGGEEKGEKSLKAFLALFGLRGLLLEGFWGPRPSQDLGVQRAIFIIR